MNTSARNSFVGRIADEWESFHEPLADFDDDPYSDEEIIEATRDYVRELVEEGLET
jgi:hypothetical protein